MIFKKTFMLTLTLSILASPLISSAEELVSGRYHGLGSKEIKVELTIGNPAPASIILVQNLPGGVKVIASNPELKKYSPAKGKAKWLLNKVKAGKMVVSVSCDRLISKGEVSGEIRYRNTSGKMVSSPLSK